MLHTNNKQVIAKMKDHVLDNFLPENYDPAYPNMPATQNLVNQIDYMRNMRDSTYQTAERYVEGGSLLVYYYDQREFLQKLLQLTPEQADKYSDDKVFKLYVHLCARAINALYIERQRELEAEWSKVGK